jgi:hypothetical protein
LFAVVIIIVGCWFLLKTPKNWQPISKKTLMHEMHERTLSQIKINWRMHATRMLWTYQPCYGIDSGEIQTPTETVEDLEEESIQALDFQEAYI